MHNCYERYLELKDIIQELEKEKRQLEKKINKNLALIFVSAIKRTNELLPSIVNKVTLIENYLPVSTKLSIFCYKTTCIF